ncbi:hypothetical protein [Micromonospora sp. ATA51]|uniref:hypothetical protein n=1 Tax=Micromonospora sp. ATA51 TaxID=2806098 RepID=UPI001A484D7E|nr:hypothetical protein [Micromonospora sp. ATA51]MBM0229554.1 hypothetical protein [Micromonospora sp. ATA51]
MRALVGQLAPGGGRWYRARPVDLEGQPSWTLAQMRAMWDGRFQGNTARLVQVLLRRDWSVLAATGWPAQVTEHNPCEWRYVQGVGRGVHEGRCGRALVGQLGETPAADERWPTCGSTGWGRCTSTRRTAAGGTTWRRCRPTCGPS